MNALSVADRDTRAVDGIWMNPATFSEMMHELSERQLQRPLHGLELNVSRGLDPTGDRMDGSFMGIAIRTDTSIPPGVVYTYPQPERMGPLPPRVDLPVLPRPRAFDLPTLESIPLKIAVPPFSLREAPPPKRKTIWDHLTED